MSQAATMPRFARAVLTLLAGIMLFDVMGAIIKHLGAEYPAQQLSMLRNFFGFIPSLILLGSSTSWHAEGRLLAIRQWRLALARGGFIAMAQFCFYVSLVHLEFATASTIAFAGPMFITALSIPLLGHHVGAWRWTAVALGFAGILMVIRPGAGVFTWYALLPLGAAFGYAASSVLVRRMDEGVPTALVNLYASIGSLTGSVLLVLATRGYTPITSVTDWGWILAMGLAGGAAVLLVITAYRSTQPSNLSPFEYFGIPFTFTLGWLFFGEAPFAKLFPGALFIVAGGLLIVWRERHLGVSDAPGPQPPSPPSPRP